MKMDLFTSIGVAILGLVLGFFVTNLINKPIEDFTYQAIDDSANSSHNYAEYSQPNAEVFNYDASNPTVEVYVGNCEKYNDNGECIDGQEDDEEDQENEGEENQNDSSSEVDNQENQ